MADGETRVMADAMGGKTTREVWKEGRQESNTCRG
jgi:hypothetical protein